ncbi:MAG: hypothetical protein U0165_11495 [Polyangiaceae bacterium]
MSITNEARAQPLGGELQLEVTERIELRPLGTRLEASRESNGRMIWEPICEAPCRLMLDTRREYRVAGSGILPSSSFRLDETSARIDVRVARSSWRALGVASIFLGMALAIASPLAGEHAQVDSRVGGGWAHPRNASDLMVGTGMMISFAGAAMAALNLWTGVSVSPGAERREGRSRVRFEGPFRLTF